MLLAYIDEIGETGAFVSREHKRFNTSPAFGYGGFIIPAENARIFSRHIHEHKRTRFKQELDRSQNPNHWEVKGSDLFRHNTPKVAPGNFRIFHSLVQYLRHLDGKLFYYANEKPIGTPKQIPFDKTERQNAAMKETLNRIARHAHNSNREAMIIFDAVNEKERVDHVSRAYSHIYSRAVSNNEMEAIIEPPMHVDSKLSTNIQFADWVAAFTSRAIDWQLINNSRFQWVTESKQNSSVIGHYTSESKLHILPQRGMNDIHHSDIFKSHRPLLDGTNSRTIGSRLGVIKATSIRNACK